MSFPLQVTLANADVIMIAQHTLTQFGPGESRAHRDRKYVKASKVTRGPGGNSLAGSMLWTAFDPHRAVRNRIVLRGRPQSGLFRTCSRNHIVSSSVSSVSN